MSALKAKLVMPGTLNGCSPLTLAPMGSIKRLFDVSDGTGVSEQFGDGCADQIEASGSQGVPLPVTGSGHRSAEPEPAPAKAGVWCADITYIPMARGFVYLVAVMDWFSRRVLAWRVSISLEAALCVEALQDAMHRHGQPEIFNTDQGVQFTSVPFLTELETLGVRISMDGKGRFLDNIFIERLWRSLKYEEVFIKAYGSPREARLGVGGWLTFYNDERPHQALDYRTPRAVFEDAAGNHVDNASASLTRYPHDYRHNSSRKVLTNVEE